MKRISSFLLAGFLAGTLTLSFGQAQKAPVDLPEGHWARDAVLYLIERGYLVGYPDGTFRGNEPLTRYQFAIALYRLLMSQPQLLMEAPPSDYALLRSLLKEFSEEMGLLDVQEAGGGGVDPSSAIAELRAQVDELAERLETQLGLLPDPSAFADLAATLLDLKGRVEDLSEGVLPPKLLQVVASRASEALEPRLRGLEARLASLEREVAALKKQVEEAHQEAKKAQDMALKASQEAATQIQNLAKSIPKQEFGLRVGYALNASDPKVPNGFYSSAFYGSHLPEQNASYRLYLGQAPEGSYMGASLLMGEGSSRGEGLEVQGLFSVSGAFGANLRFAGSLGTGAYGLEVGFQTASFPKGVLSDFNGGRFWARGDISDIRLYVEGRYGLTAPGADVLASVTLPVESPTCSRSLLQGKGGLQMPFLGFAIVASGGYHSETAALPSCTEPDISFTSYEVGLAHLADSPQALVPNLYLYGYYGGYSGDVSGSSIGLSYFGGRGSFSFSLGDALAVLVGGEYKAISPSGSHALLNPSYRMGVYALGNTAYMAAKARGILNPSGDLRFSLEASYERMESAFSSARLGFSPGLELAVGDLAFSLGFQYALLSNWDPTLPNPQAPIGRSDSLLVALDGKGYGFSVAASFSIAPSLGGRVSASYGFRW